MQPRFVYMEILYLLKPGAFNSRPDATVEDVLKKLPGMQVQKDGTISAMGEIVQKVYVNGKEFFGNDPKLAKKNITADMVDQIQVYDDMSEQAKFTRIDDGSRSKTINIKLKKDKNRGDFGRFTAVGAQITSTKVIYRITVFVMNKKFQSWLLPTIPINRVIVSTMVLLAIHNSVRVDLRPV